MEGLLDIVTLLAFGRNTVIYYRVCWLCSNCVVRESNSGATCNRGLPFCKVLFKLASWLHFKLYGCFIFWYDEYILCWSC